MIFRDLLWRLVFLVTPDNPIRDGKIVRANVSCKIYQESTEDQANMFVAGAIDMFNQMIKHQSPARRAWMTAMSDYASDVPNKRVVAELRERFDQYLADDAERCSVCAANAFLLFLEEETSKIRLRDGKLRLSHENDASRTNI